jgi:hypothetical protein
MEGFMRIEATVVTALAGTGKTTWISNKVNETARINKVANILVLSFNRHTRFDMQNRIIDQENITVHTFHSFAYEVCKKANSLPPAFSQLDGNFENYDLQATEYEELLDIAIRKLKIGNGISNFDHVYVDEAQDITSKMHELLYYCIRSQQSSVTPVVVGDEYQVIYSFVNNRKSKKQPFPHLYVDVNKSNPIVLNRSYRSTDAITTFVNGFYRNVFDGSRYFQQHVTELGEKPLVTFVDDFAALESEVQNVVAEHSGNSIHVLCRVNREVELLEELRSTEYSEVVFSTIHASKGTEADVIVVVNHQFSGYPVSDLDRNTWNVAITRARKKLIIISTFPSCRITPMFEPGTFRLIQKQKMIEPLLPDLPLERRPVTIDSVKKSMIDSIRIQYDYNQLQSIPYFSQNMKKKCPFLTEHHTELNGLPVLLRRHNNKIDFEFTDLNLAKCNNLTDTDIINRIANGICLYFGTDISRVFQGKINRLDLAKYIPTRDYQNTFRILKTLFRIGRGSVSSILDYSFAHGEFTGQHTVYWNVKRELNGNGRTLVAYRPSEKAKNSVVGGEDYVKIEQRRFGNDVTLPVSKRATATLSDLLTVIQGGSIDGLFRKWMRSEFLSGSFDSNKFTMYSALRRSVHSRIDVFRYFGRRIKILDEYESEEEFIAAIDEMSIDGRLKWEYAHRKTSNEVRVLFSYWISILSDEEQQEILSMI